MSNETLREALEPCPFCGESSDLTVHVYGNGDDDAYVQCRECTTCGPDGGDRAGAITKWNYRALSQPMPEAAQGWIHVDRQMPKSGQIVLALQKWDHSGKLGVIRAAWVAAKTEESSPESDIGEYDEATDTYYDPEGWYEQISHWDEIAAAGVNGATIVAWMPLPDVLSASPAAPAQPQATEGEKPFAWLCPSVAPHYHAPLTHWGEKPPEPLSAEEALSLGWFPVFKGFSAQPQATEGERILSASDWVEQNVSGNPVLMQAMKNYAENAEPPYANTPAPQATEGEPEVVATVSSRWSNGRGFDVDDFGKNLPNYGDALITLQSHRGFVKAAYYDGYTEREKEVRELLAQHRAALEKCVGALEFYAGGSHFTMHDPDAWDTVSGEPQNFYEDENNTATVEDGSIAKAAITHANQVLDRKEGE